MRLFNFFRSYLPAVDHAVRSGVSAFGALRREKALLLLISLSAAGLFSSQPLFAQLPSTAGDETDKYSYLLLTFEAYHMNNGDFKNYDRKKYGDEKVLPARNSDDAANIFLGAVEFGYSRRFAVTGINLVVSKYGCFGNDNFENADDAINPFRLHQADIALFPNEAIELKLGRTPYDFGDAVNDYFFYDTIDGIILTCRFMPAASPLELKITGDVLSNSVNHEMIRSGSVIRNDEERVDDFQGDTTGWRAGAVLRYLCLKSFHYYLVYGANSQGAADIAENGKNPVNEADHDFLTLHGARLFYSGALVSADYTFAWSYGRDNQYDCAYTYNGFASAANLKLNLGTEGFKIAPLDSFVFSGGYFQPDYCSMKSASPAGVVLFTQKSYYPSPYAGAYHFTDGQKNLSAVKDFDASVSKSFVRNTLSFKAGILAGELSHLVIFANESKKRLISNIPEEEVRGKGDFQLMGNEITAELTLKVEEISFYLTGGVYLPSDYYRIRAKYNTNFPEGSDPMYGAILGSTYYFRL